MRLPNTLLLSAVFALAFGGIAFYGYGESQKHAANEAEITQIRDRFDGYTSKEMVPTKQNLDELKDAFSEVAAARADIQAEMNRYAEQCLGDGKKISAMDLQERLKASSNTVNKLASSNGVKLGRSASELLRKVQAARFVAEHGDQVCPAAWQPGEETLTPSLDLVGLL